MTATDPQTGFKKAAGHFASGVTIVTTRNGGHVYGITCSSFVSLSLNPLLVTVSVNSQSPFLAEVRESGCLAVSVLADQQQDVSRYFATRGRGRAEGEFPNLATESMTTGAPIVSDCLSWFDAKLHAILPGGDHKILIGEVVAAGGRDGAPLLYWAGNYRTLDVAPPVDRIEQYADAMSVQLHLIGLDSTGLLDAQLALEPAAGALAARVRSAAGLSALRASLAESRTLTADPEAFTESALRFHTALGAASENPAVAASVQALGRSRRAHYANGTTRESMIRTIEAHERIYRAIESGDAERTRALVTDHLTTVGARLCHQ
ncbi:flavin reductase (DIM6/NTAB) family NADH-FMN oxidoreductase RutF [Actinomadura pelletieri DSM 43383]|uniref:Flavin reductase (DIM6/NTAB) family NADH-FMN oxidoreductase RutF n=1 Tax=Actinomadura pelletieri DSM 43383 TaxID=1120940 RepID=A0A495Q9U8_9ACTN|nr:flavin reductase [Actinomadura pelletieri]RKS68263.1 flavin reductase (DIM6/NTAB) family NADH-FMN oxidoreductase RutF [Actinomadura pelletieri DSM 43383]